MVILKWKLYRKDNRIYTHAQRVNTYSSSVQRMKPRASKIINITDPALQGLSVDQMGDQYAIILSKIKSILSPITDTVHILVHRIQKGSLKLPMQTWAGKI